VSSLAIADLPAHDAGRLLVGAAAMLRRMASDNRNTTLSQLLSTNDKALTWEALQSLGEQGHKRYPYLRQTPLDMGVSEKVFNNRAADITLSNQMAEAVARCSYYGVIKDTPALGDPARSGLIDAISNAYVSLLLANGRATQRRDIAERFDQSLVNAGALVGLSPDAMSGLLAEAETVSLVKHRTAILSQFDKEAEDELTL
jgi:hypothetical protein